MNRLKTAILGLNEEGRLLAQAVHRSGLYQIQALADKDAKLAERIAAEYDCPCYDDYRQLIIQNQLDCLLVAEAIYACDEYVRMAMKKKFNILKLAPPARNFQETIELVRLAENENVKFAVANHRRFAKSYLALQRFLREEVLEQISLVTAVCSFGDIKHPPWQTDPQLAGGGVLLRNCYQIIDQIICSFNTPQMVYCLNTSHAEDRQQRLYLTEDTALVTMKFSDILSGNLIAAKTFGPGKQVLTVYAREKILTVSDSLFTVTDTEGKPIEQVQYEDDRFGSMTRLLENFALSLLLPAENKLASTARENLRNMAVIETAYLSARTGMPEEPAKILQLAPWHDGEQ
jgi:predicted dehydrogenase